MENRGVTRGESCGNTGTKRNTMSAFWGDATIIWNKASTQIRSAPSLFTAKKEMKNTVPPYQFENIQKTNIKSQLNESSW